jgi:LPPG:FO 2-phospho-L-lactate transferase
MPAESAKPAYLALTGGIGGAKLALGLSRSLADEEIAFVVNTGDDFTHLGLHISPDIDTLTYTLAGVNNPETGWGRRDETWNFMEKLRSLDSEQWFLLGDKDLALNSERTLRLKAGESLSEVTTALAASLGVRQRIAPMSDDPVATRVLTDDGELDFQHYFVREKCEPRVRGIRFEGADRAAISPRLAEWLDAPALKGVIICPSNPYLSVDPMLAVSRLRQKLCDCGAPVIAVSPVVGGAAIKGPTVKIMQELGVPNTATRVAEHYRDFLSGFVIDEADRAECESIENLGMKVLVTNTIMKSLEDRVQLAEACLAFLGEIGQTGRR